MLMFASFRRRTILYVNLQEPAGVVARSKIGVSSLSPLPPGTYSPKPLPAEVLLNVLSAFVDRFGERGAWHRTCTV